MPDELISIIIPTISRSVQLDALLNSIVCSTYKHYEIIVIDQNKTIRLDDVIFKYRQQMPIQHVKVDFTGASRARNYGLRFAKGQYLFFPDDDSELFPDTLALILKNFHTTGAEVVFGKCVDRTMADSVALFSGESGYLSPEHYEGMFIEATLCIRKETFSRFLFDESFGIGTFYGAEEAYDLVLRMLDRKVRIFYTPEIKIYHPQKITNYSEAAERRRVFSYRCGFAHLCLKHKLYGKYLSRLMKVMVYLPYTAVFAPGKTRYYLSELMGLLTGVIVR